MSVSGPIQIPSSGVFQWALNNPDAPKEAVALLNKIATCEISLVDSSSSRSGEALVISDQNALLVLPILWAGGVAENIASYSATMDASYSQAQIQALSNHVSTLTTLVNSMLDAERKWQERAR